MEDLEKAIGRYLLNITPHENNKNYIMEIIKLKNEICDLLIRAEKDLQADFTTDLFINFIKADKNFGKLYLHSVEFTYNNIMYVVYNFDEKIKIEII